MVGKKKTNGNDPKNALVFLKNNPGVLFPLPAIVLGIFAPLGATVGLFFASDALSFMWFIILFISIFVFFITQSFFTAYLFQRAVSRLNRDHLSALSRAMLGTFPTAFTEFMGFLTVLLASLALITGGTIINTATNLPYINSIALILSGILFVGYKLSLPEIWKRTQIHHEVGITALVNACSSAIKNWKSLLLYGLLFAVGALILTALFLSITPTSGIAMIIYFSSILGLYAWYTAIFAIN